MPQWRGSVPGNKESSSHFHSHESSHFVNYSPLYSTRIKTSVSVYSYLHRVCQSSGQAGNLPMFHAEAPTPRPQQDSGCRRAPGRGGQGPDDLVDLPPYNLLFNSSTSNGTFPAHLSRAYLGLRWESSPQQVIPHVQLSQPG